MGILGCAQMLDLNTEVRAISICSDSQVALRGLEVPETRSRLVGKCKEALGRLAERNRVHLLLVLRHTMLFYSSGTPFFGFREKNVFKNCDKLEPSTNSRNYVGSLKKK